jgi:hypothetical protein
VAIPDEFINTRRTPGFGYATLLALNILKHLDTEYGSVSTPELNYSIILWNKPWNHSQPMEYLFAYIRFCVEYSKITSLISENTLVRSALTNIQNTELFNDDVCDWDKLDPAAQTMKAFKLLSCTLKKHNVAAPLPLWQQVTIMKLKPSPPQPVPAPTSIAWLLVVSTAGVTSWDAILFTPAPSATTRALDIASKPPSQKLGIFP